MITMDERERAALLTGLRYAALLKRHFPDFFLDHVATRKMTMGDLLGAAGAFLSLAHTQLIALDIEHTEGVPIKPKDPTQALRDASYYNYTAKSYLLNGAYHWLHAPSLRVYGLGIESVAPDDRYDYYGRQAKPSAIEKHSLALLIWRLISDTRWETMRDTAVAKLAMERVGNLDLARAIATARPLPRETPLRALCIELDRQSPPGFAHLGTIIAYVCKCIGNPYADATPAEMRQRYDQLIDFDWDRSTAFFADARADQQAAARYSSTYSRLGTRLWKNPELVGDLIRAIDSAAIEVVRASDSGDSTPYDPRALINHLGENDEAATDEA